MCVTEKQILWIFPTGFYRILNLSFQNILVHSWTQDMVLRWLREFVELPQYEKNFKEFKVNGNTLPR